MTVLKMTSKAFCIRKGQHSNRSPLHVGFDLWLCNVNVKVFCNSGICLCTSKWDSRICTGHLNTTTVVVLEVLFPYGFIYEMGPPMLEKQVKESQSCATPPLFTQAGVGA